MRWSSSHLVVFSSLFPPWMVLVFVCVLARSSTAAPAVVSVCGTEFTDTESSALLADIVLEGRVRKKIPLSDSSSSNNNSPALGDGVGVFAGHRDLYNVDIQVRKHIWKGKDLIQHKRLTIGTFSPVQNSADDTSNIVTAIRPDAGDGGGAVRADDKTCIGDVADGGSYIFFLRDVGDKKGKYFELSALPVKKGRKEARQVSKILRKNRAQAPNIQRLKAPRKVTTGSSLTLRCKAKAKPNPVFRWYRNGQEIVAGRGIRIKNSKRGSRLKIAKAQSDDAGVYSCVASNALGEASKNVTVKVSVARRVPSKPTTKTTTTTTATKPQYTTELDVQTTASIYDRQMNDGNASANASADNFVKEEEKIYRACEKQTFCFNGGTCRYIQEMHQTFCECPESYEGKRCEKQIAHPSILTGEDSLEIFHMFAKGEATLLYERTLIIVGIVIAVFVFVVICIASYCLANRRRKRFEAKRRLRRQQGRGGPEADALLNKTEERGGMGGLVQPHFVPSYKPSVPKETQTDPDYHPPDAPPRREHESEPNFSQPNNIFLRDNSFPLMRAAGQPAAPPPYANGQRPNSAQHVMERRGSRGRLKAVSVDDSCKDRPKSWKPNEVPDSMSMPAIADGNSREALEMGKLPPRSQTGLPTVGGNNREDSEVPKPGEGSNPRDSNPWGGEPGDENPWPLLPELAVPVKMETQPTANAHAQLKTPEERQAESLEPQPAVLPVREVTNPKPRSSDLGFGFGASLPPAPPPMNGILQESSDEEGEPSPLPTLHISEEDLNGNLPKADRQPDSSSSSYPLPPPPPPPQSQAYRPKAFPDGSYLPPYGAGVSPKSLSEEDSAGFQPLELTNSEELSPSAPGSTPLGEAYAFDPCMDSDTEFDDQFMHGSPKKAVYRGGAEDKQDYERRLQNVRDNQEAIPI